MVRDLDKGYGEPREPRGSPRESVVVRGCPGEERPGVGARESGGGQARGVRALREEGHQN